MDRDTIELLTLMVRIYRQLRTMGVYDVAIELKGLRANMMKLQARVDRLNSIAAGADEKGAMLESHLSDIHGQLGAHVDDIEFAANILGNSPPASDVLSKPLQPARTCQTCAGTDFTPFDEQTATGVRHGFRCTQCSTIAWVAA
jgi:hypothetical protein